MKTDCEFFDECRRPVQVCKAKCPDYKTRKRDEKLTDTNVREQKKDRQFPLADKTYYK
jgi:hypothetical protein